VELRRGKGHIRRHDRSFMQGAIVNQSASTAGHEIDAGPRDREGESHSGRGEGATTINILFARISSLPSPSGRPTGPSSAVSFRVTRIEKKLSAFSSRLDCKNPPARLPCKYFLPFSCMRRQKARGEETVAMNGGTHVPCIHVRSVRELDGISGRVLISSCEANEKNLR